MHITEGHPEMAGHLDDVLFAVAAPGFIVQGSFGVLIAVAYEKINKSPVVVSVPAESLAEDLAVIRVRPLMF